MSIILDLERPATWPDDLKQYLKLNHDSFCNWESELYSRMLADYQPRASEVIAAASGKRNFARWFSSYESALAGLGAVLQPYNIPGWHCSRLTYSEISLIELEGMQLPDGSMLSRRINLLVSQGLLAEALATRLKSENEASDEYRSGKLWFCFFLPHRAEESGINRFFRHWGGEALYNSHEDDPLTGAALQQIGCPCVVEAMVPIVSLWSLNSLSSTIARRYLKSLGHKTLQIFDHEDAITSSLLARNVLAITRFPSGKFNELTGCDQWSQPLAVADVKRPETRPPYDTCGSQLHESPVFD